jgi:uncharacterized small protein (DUF1192 family)
MERHPGDSRVNRPLASLSLDLDNQWSYMKTHGDPGWQDYPSYLDIVVPRVLEVLDALGLKITFFVVGQDAAMETNRGPLASLAAAGHEIGNHSFRHDPWLHLYSEGEIEAEIALAEEAIEGATGQRPVGFRGPGFSLSEATVRVLMRRGYRYDCSTFPTFFGPLARAYYFKRARLVDEERHKRKLLFGTLRQGLRPLKPYVWRMGAMSLTEIPVTTMPIFRSPIHLSYVLYLSLFSASVARAYFVSALGLCQMTGTEPSLLLHPLDFLGGDDVAVLSFFPAMRIAGKLKTRRTMEYLELLAERFDAVPLALYAERVAARTRIAMHRYI